MSMMYKFHWPPLHQLTQPFTYYIIMITITIIKMIITHCTVNDNQENTEVQQTISGVVVLRIGPQEALQKL